MTIFIAVSVGWCFANLVAYLWNVATDANVFTTPGTRACDAFICLVTLAWGIWLLAKG